LCADPLSCVRSCAAASPPPSLTRRTAAAMSEWHSVATAEGGALRLRGSARPTREYNDGAAPAVFACAAANAD
jgi:hypothetical protein